jgi:DNA-binding MurR/RpiR family transcriptional regulator
MSSKDRSAPSTTSAISDDVFSRISSALPSLAPAEQRVGRVLLAQPSSAANLTITDLASMADTSETTVVRFCRSIGTTSYRGLRIALATAAAKVGHQPAPQLAPDIRADDDLAVVIAKVGASDVQAITDTISHLDPGLLARVVDAVTAARRIDIYGAAASAIVAVDLQQKLHRIGLTAYAWSDAHLAIPSAANLSPADVAIAISHSGTTTDTIDALAQAGRTGATTVAITNFARSPVVGVADIVLRTSASEVAFRSGAMASRIAELMLIDCLFVGVAQKRYPEILEALARTRSAVSSRHRGRSPGTWEGRGLQ